MRGLSREPALTLDGLVDPHQQPIEAASKIVDLLQARRDRQTFAMTRAQAHDPVGYLGQGAQTSSRNHAAQHRAQQERSQASQPEHRHEAVAGPVHVLAGAPDQDAQRTDRPLADAPAGHVLAVVIADRVQVRPIPSGGDRCATLVDCFDPDAGRAVLVDLPPQPALAGCGRVVQLGQARHRGAGHVHQSSVALPAHPAVDAEQRESKHPGQDDGGGEELGQRHPTNECPDSHHRSSNA